MVGGVVVVVMVAVMVVMVIMVVVIVVVWRHEGRVWRRKSWTTPSHYYSLSHDTQSPTPLI